MEHEISMEQRLNRIEQLLAGQKNVLTFDEACTYTGISRTYMYKLTCFHATYLRDHHQKDGILAYIPVICRQDILRALVQNGI